LSSAPGRFGERAAGCREPASLPSARWTKAALVALLVTAAVLYEARTSAIEALVLSHYGSRMGYAVENGPSPRIVFPSGGPFDERRGYARIPEFRARLEAQGYQIIRQAHVSETLAFLARWGIPPPYRELTTTALRIDSSDGATLAINLRLASPRGPRPAV
jgi:hypothetical protein